MHKRYVAFRVIFTLFITSAAFSCANVQASQSLKLASIFADDMVLQQQVDAAIWGKAQSSKKVAVTVSWSKELYQTVADSKGNWSIKVKTPKAGGPFKLTVKSGDEKIELDNVLSGEVWICSGQSNMQWRMHGFGPDQFRDDVEKADYPNIRYCLVNQVFALQEQETVKTQWSVCSPATVPAFSAVAYFFASKLYDEIEVPIGLISTNWGGSSAEAWCSSDVLSEDFPDFNARMQEYPEIIKETGLLYTRSQKKPKGLSHRNPAVLYNSMIKPLIPFAFRGVIWYQGESNVERPIQYRKLFPALIENWRDKWGIGDFPFYYVQIAPFNYNNAKNKAAYLREAQMMALSAPKTGMVVTMDIGNETNIHSKAKKPVGYRLAKLALAKDYGKNDIVYSGPLYKSFKVEGDGIRLKFDHTGSGLITRDGKQLSHFTIANKDKIFVDAKAVIEGDTIVVSSDAVADPVAVRYGWGNADMPNLSNKEGLPASSFRTDDWEME